MAGDAAATTDQWRGVLRRHSGRPTLWRAYLAFRRSDFAAFTARRLRHLHDDALDVRCRPPVHNLCSFLLCVRCFINVPHFGRKQQ